MVHQLLLPLYLDSGWARRISAKNCMVTKLATGSGFSSCSCWCAIILPKIPGKVFPNPACNGLGHLLKRREEQTNFPSVPRKEIFDDSFGPVDW